MCGLFWFGSFTLFGVIRFFPFLVGGLVGRDVGQLGLISLLIDIWIAIFIHVLLL
jgi:hypothetical protein